MKPISNIVYWIHYLSISSILNLQENIYTYPNTHYMSAGEASRRVVFFLDLFTDVFLEVQNKRYSSILYLIDDIAYGLHLWHEIYIFKEICRKHVSLHPGLLGGALGGKYILYTVWGKIQPLKRMLTLLDFGNF